MRINSFAEYLSEYEKSIKKPEEFWAEKAEAFIWKKKWNEVLEWNFSEPYVQWFKGARLNITENCLDRHAAAFPDRKALIWEANNPAEESRSFTYSELLDEVCRFSNVLNKLGIKKGDRVCIYMPMVPELVIAVLSCARIGAIHSVVFGGFSSQSVSERINDAGCSFVITADGAFRGEKIINLKSTIDEALEYCSSVKNVIVLQRTGTTVSMKSNRDFWWHDLVKAEDTHFPAVETDAEDMLFILYTSGSTGKPKGVVHTAAGYMIYAAYTFQNVFQYNAGDVFFCTADIGWITGHSYIVYGPLLSGATSLIFEGIPTFPNAGRFWDIVEKHQVNTFYTAPTAIRSLMSFGDQWTEGKDLSSLKILGTVGEPINEEAWHWYHEKIGNNNCPIVDTWWQTETGGIMISPLAGITKTKPAFATLPLPGIQPVLVDEHGKELTGNNVSGNLCIKFPWPGMIRTTYGDHERCRQNYFSTYKNLYFTGDGCLRDEDGYYRITGRVDDVINVSGHRIGTAELENVIDQHDDVIETAVVGFSHDIKGQALYAFIICKDQINEPEKLRLSILELVTKSIGSFAKPDKIQMVTGLPKTRSGKIMRRILRKIAEGDFENLGDTTTLLDPGVVEQIVKGRVL